MSIKAIAIVITVAIAVGLALGGELYLHRHAIKNEVAPPKNIEVLSLKGLLTPSFVDSFQKRTGIKLTLTEVANPEEVTEQLQNHPFDVAPMFSYQVRQAVQTGRLQQIDKAKLHGLADISPDFLDSRSELLMVPILWGVDETIFDSKRISEPGSLTELFRTQKSKAKLGLVSSTADLDWLLSIAFHVGTDGIEYAKGISTLLSQSVVGHDFADPTDLVSAEHPPNILLVSHGRLAFAPLKDSDWKVAQTTEGYLFWTLGFSIAKSAQNLESAYEFLNDTLRSEAAEGMVANFKAASSNRKLETSAIDPRLKASYLRQIPLNKINAWKESAHAAELRAALKSDQAESD